MKRFIPTLWLSFGLVSLTLALSLSAYIMGLMPDGFKAELDARAKVAESLAIQLVGAINRKDVPVLRETIDSVVKRNADVNSVALRGMDGKLIIQWPGGEIQPTLMQAVIALLVIVFLVLIVNYIPSIVVCMTPIESHPDIVNLNLLLLLGQCKMICFEGQKNAACPLVFA